MNSCSIRARAKINLTLNVRPLPKALRAADQRVASPYHELTSVFHLVELADEVTVTPAGSAKPDRPGRFELSCTGQGLEKLSITENLAWKAALAFAEATGRELPALHVHIEKHIPSGAGLAGGSADAAAMLLLLAHEAGMLVTNTPEVLVTIAVSLGADVAFFLQDSAACLMGGVGDELCAILQPAEGVPMVIAWDRAAPVSTPQVYHTFEQYQQPVNVAAEEAFAGALDCADIEQLASHLYNNLSAAAFQISPAARSVHEFLQQAPQSLGAALSGSGGASFALCASRSDRDALAQAAQAAGFAARGTELATQTLTAQFAQFDLPRERK